MFGSPTSFEGSLFDEFQRLQTEMDELFGQWTWPAGIRSLPRGTFPPINIGVTPERVDVYVFAAGLDPKSIDVSLQQNLLTVSGERNLPLQRARDLLSTRAFQRLLSARAQPAGGRRTGPGGGFLQRWHAADPGKATRGRTPASD